MSHDTVGEREGKIKKRGFPRWWLEGGSRKRASFSEILARRWRHTLQAKSQKKRQNIDPSTPPPGAENLHFMLSGETRRSPRPRVACAQTAWEDVDKLTVD
jgi:hypothetical protein